MSFVFQTDAGFVIVDSKSRQGIYTQSYTKEGFSKPSTLASFTSNNYSATLDPLQRLHIVAENNKNQIIYICSHQGYVTRHVILEDTKHLYHFSDLHLFSTSSALYMFYTVKNPIGNTRALVWQSINGGSSTIYTLVPSIPSECRVKFFEVDTKLYILYTDFLQDHELRLISFSADQSNQRCIFHSHIPIFDYNLCQTSTGMYLVIQKDAYGQQQLSFLDLNKGIEQPLPVSSVIRHPCIFSYCNILWITYLNQDTLYLLISDRGLSQFSVPVKSSLQGYLIPCTYKPLPQSILSATALILQLTPQIRIPIVSTFDIRGIHPDLPISTELDLLFDAMEFSSNIFPDVTTPSPLPPSTPFIAYTPPPSSYPSFAPHPQPMTTTPPPTTPFEYSSSDTTAFLSPDPYLSSPTSYEPTGSIISSLTDDSAKPLKDIAKAFVDHSKGFEPS